MKLLCPVLLFSSFTMVSAQPNPSTGRIERHALFQSEHVQPRHVDVWLPARYDGSKEFAVLYMHDGQMLYDAAQTWNRQAWDVDDTLERLMSEDEIRDVIVVGIWNTGETRHAEYFPENALDYLSPAEKHELLKLASGGPRANAYLRFLVQELKPFIDKTYRTKPEVENTFIAGSSMGGLISMYALCEYPEIFSGAACLSTHWIGKFDNTDNPIPQAFLEYLRAKLPAPGKHRIYFDYGTETLDRFYAPHQKKVDQVMIEKGYDQNNWMTREFEGEDHSERAWAKRLAIPMRFLLR